MNNDWWCGSYDDHEPHPHLGGHTCLGVTDRKYRTAPRPNDDLDPNVLYERVRALTEENHRLAMRNASLEQRIIEYRHQAAGRGH